MTYPSKSDFCVFEAGCQEFRQNSRDPDHQSAQMQSLHFVPFWRSMGDIVKSALEHAQIISEEYPRNQKQWFLQGWGLGDVQTGVEGDLLFTTCFQYDLNAFTICTCFQFKNK